MQTHLHCCQCLHYCCAQHSKPSFQNTFIILNKVKFQSWQQQQKRMCDLFNYFFFHYFSKVFPLISHGCLNLSQIASISFQNFSFSTPSPATFSLVYFRTAMSKRSARRIWRLVRSIHRGASTKVDITTATVDSPLVPCLMRRSDRPT